MKRLLLLPISLCLLTGCADPKEQKREEIYADLQGLFFYPTENDYDSDRYYTFSFDDSEPKEYRGQLTYTQEMYDDFNTFKVLEDSTLIFFDKNAEVETVNDRYPYREYKYTEKREVALANSEYYCLESDLLIVDQKPFKKVSENFFVHAANIRNYLKEYGYLEKVKY